MKTKNNMENSEAKFITAKKAAERLMTSEAQVFEWIRNNTITAPVVARINRKIIIDSRELDLWLKNGGTAQKSAISVSA